MRDTLSVLLGMNIQMPGDEEMETEAPPPPKPKTPPSEPKKDVPSHVAEVRHLKWYFFIS